MNRLVLRPGHDRRLRAGHPWIFSNEVGTIEGEPIGGDAVHLVSAGGDFLGTGYYNPHSLIASRLLSRQPADIDSPEFFRPRLLAAQAYRQAVYGDAEGVRLVHGEGDGLPGLVVDRYGPVLSVQFLALGMERRRHLLLPLLLEQFRPTAMVARNDVAVRELEGLPQTVELLHGEVPADLTVNEHGLRLRVDVVGGQKTGHFLDQKENHLALRERVSGQRVLDLFCYSGSWALHAALFGAQAVTGIDISPSAVALAEENARLNGLAGVCTFQRADVFDFLRQAARTGQRFGTVILDPPAFVKSRKKLPEAIRGYLTVNRRAMELVEPGGYLFTCSCSFHLGREPFLDLLRQAAALARRSVRLVELRGQAYDHPVLLACPETEYLKCAVLQVL
ncbi:MAG: class I SAM-dependent rRNA methyltransferase [Desulfuromonadales bacterium]|nr:class I SAM-dependent rRNA methyltransferase [Desulfuromonadales bacterium]